MADDQRIADLEARIAQLEARLNQVAINSERALETQALFAASGVGTNGTAKQAARVDHTH